MQRKLAGYARAMIFLAQDFMTNFASRNAQDIVSEKKKRSVAKINDAIRPWALLLIKLTNDSKMKSLRPFIDEKVDT